jgi:hypothetical protein
MMNIGVRPTFNGTTLRLEAHLLDFDGDLYDSQLTVQFFHRIRSEMAFSHIDASKSQRGRPSRRSIFVSLIYQPSQPVMRFILWIPRLFFPAPLLAQNSRTRLQSG